MLLKQCDADGILHELDENQKYYQEGVKINDLKELLADKNKDFLGTHMQDSLEYLQHLFGVLQRAEKQEKLPESVNLFNFKSVTHLQCLACSGVKLAETAARELKLPVRRPTPQELEQAALEKRQKQAQSKNEQETIVLDFEGPTYRTSFEESVQMLRQVLFFFMLLFKQFKF